MNIYSKMFSHPVLSAVCLIYTLFCIFYVLPSLNSKRELVCNFMASVRPVMMIYNQMFDKGIFQQSSLGHICLGITYVIPKNAETSDISSLNFVYSKYYKDRSTGPKELFEPEKSWKYGPSTLINYMNINYSSIQHNMKNNPPIIFQRRGYRGIPTQIFCTCDTILLGVLVDKPVQSSSVSFLNISYCSESPRSFLFVSVVQLHLSDRPASLYRCSFVLEMKPRVRPLEPSRRHHRQRGPRYRVVPQEGAGWSHQQRASHRRVRWVDAAGAVEHGGETTDQESLASCQIRLASGCTAT